MQDLKVLLHENACLSPCKIIVASNAFLPCNIHSSMYCKIFARFSKDIILACKCPFPFTCSLAGMLLDEQVTL